MLLKKTPCKLPLALCCFWQEYMMSSCVQENCIKTVGFVHFLLLFIGRMTSGNVKVIYSSRILAAKVAKDLVPVPLFEPDLAFPHGAPCLWYLCKTPLFQCYQYFWWETWVQLSSWESLVTCAVLSFYNSRGEIHDFFSSLVEGKVLEKVVLQSGIKFWFSNTLSL